MAGWQAPRGPGPDRGRVAAVPLPPAPAPEQIAEDAGTRARNLANNRSELRRREGGPQIPA